MKAEDIKAFATMLNISIPFVVAIVVFVLCVIYVDKLLLFVSQIQKFFSFLSSKARKGAISNSIRGKILGSSRKMSSFSDGIIADDLKIEWVKEENAETFIKNNQVIIRMSQNSNPHKNYVTAVKTFVGSGLLPKARKYIDPAILNASKVAIGRMLVINGDPDAIDYYDETVLDPLLLLDNEVAERYGELKTIDKNGMLINILLNEYAKTAKKIFPETPDPLLVAESKELLNYLHRIALGIWDDVSELKFNREYFKIHIFLTAKSSTYRKKGIRPYLKYIRQSISEGVETIYVFGLGKKMEVAKEIASELQQTDFRIDSVLTHNYRHISLDGRSVSGVCYEVVIYNDGISS